MKPHNILLIMAAVCATIQLGMDQFPDVAFTLIRDWRPVWSQLVVPPNPTPTFDSQILT